MKHALEWLKTHEADQVRDLAELVAIPSISTDGAESLKISLARARESVP